MELLALKNKALNQPFKIFKPKTMFKKEDKTWITEAEAAAIIELPAKFFRNLVLAGSLKGVITYLISKTNSYSYNKTDIENFIFEDSFFVSL